jgi:hypothetical protein
MSSSAWSKIIAAICKRVDYNALCFGIDADGLTLLYDFSQDLVMDPVMRAKFAVTARSGAASGTAADEPPAKRTRI